MRDEDENKPHYGQERTLTEFSVCTGVWLASALALQRTGVWLATLALQRTGVTAALSCFKVSMGNFLFLRFLSFFLLYNIFWSYSLPFFNSKIHFIFSLIKPKPNQEEEKGTIGPVVCCPTSYSCACGLPALGGG